MLLHTFTYFLTEQMDKAQVIWLGQMIFEYYQSN